MRHVMLSGALQHNLRALRRLAPHPPARLMSTLIKPGTPPTVSPTVASAEPPTAISLAVDVRPDVPVHRLLTDSCSAVTGPATVPAAAAPPAQLDAWSFSQDGVRAKMARCEELVGYTFRDKELLLIALNRSGKLARACDGEQPRPVAQNQALAVYGDSIADAMLCGRWYAGSVSESALSCGAWTTLRLKQLSNGNLSKVARRRGLDSCIITNPGTISLGLPAKSSVVEALIGAVFIDSGHDFKTTVDFMESLGLFDNPILSGAASS